MVQVVGRCSSKLEATWKARFWIPDRLEYLHTPWVGSQEAGGLQLEILLSVLVCLSVYHEIYELKKKT